MTTKTRSPKLPSSMTLRPHARWWTSVPVGQYRRVTPPTVRRCIFHDFTGIKEQQHHQTGWLSLTGIVKNRNQLRRIWSKTATLKPGKWHPVQKPYVHHRLQITDQYDPCACANTKRWDNYSPYHRTRRREARYFYTGPCMQPPNRHTGIVIPISLAQLTGTSDLMNSID